MVNMGPGHYRGDSNINFQTCQGIWQNAKHLGFKVELFKIAQISKIIGRFSSSPFLLKFPPITSGATREEFSLPY